MSQLSRSVLVVEDDDDIREALREVLEDEGFVPLLAANGRMALDLLERGANPCVILLDLMMPVLNGWQFLEIQNNSEKLARIPTILLTAATDRQIPTTRSSLRKPLDLIELLSLIHSYCGQAD